MIIQSKFHDYYDCILKVVGVDKSVVYNRTTQKKSVKLPVKLPTYHTYECGRHDEYLEYVVFCGKLYPVLSARSGWWDITKDNHWVKYSIMDICGHIKASPSIFPSVQNYDWTSFCIENKCPIIIITPYYRDYNVFCNPCLKHYGFYAAVSPFDAYQTLFQFISMVNTKPEKEPKPISDKLKATNHGFDKWSFRKDTPPKRKTVCK